MTSASQHWSFDDLKPQVQLSDNLAEDSHLPPTENHYNDVTQTNISSSTVRLQTLDGIMQWLKH